MTSLKINTVNKLENQEISYIKDHNQNLLTEMGKLKNNKKSEK